MHYSRRQMFKISSAAAAGISANFFIEKKLLSLTKQSERIQSPQHTSPALLSQDEEFWKKVAAQFQVDPSFINLENGYYGIMPNPVYENYLENTKRLNQLNSYLFRTSYKTELISIREYLAQVLVVPPDELCLTRCGTEALQNLISGYNKLEPGDQVMYADLDYYSCQYAFDWLQKSRKVELVKINIPEPAEKQAILDLYAEYFANLPKLKLILLTHLNNRTGLVLPIRELVAMARERGIDAIVDVAHSWGQLNFNLSDLDADFVGLSLHKWINAPLGAGCLYIKKSRLKDIDPCFADQTYTITDVRSRAHSGTLNIAAFLTLPTALKFHLDLGAQSKEERLRYLRNYWVSRVSAIDSIQILTPNHPEMHGGITSFRIKGRNTQIENEDIAKYLFQKHRIFTVRRSGVQKGDCVRVTPALFTSIHDVEKLAVALEEVVQLL